MNAPNPQTCPYRADPATAAPYCPACLIDAASPDLDVFWAVAHLGLTERQALCRQLREAALKESAA